MPDETQATDTGQEPDGATEGHAEGQGPAERMRGLISELTREPKMKVDAPERFARLNAEIAKLAEQAEQADAAEPATSRFGTPEELEALASDEADAAAADAQVEGEARLAATHAAWDALSDAVDGQDIGLDWVNDLQAVPPGVDAALGALTAISKCDLAGAVPLLDAALAGMPSEVRTLVRQVGEADLPELVRAEFIATVLFDMVDRAKPQHSERDE